MRRRRILAPLAGVLAALVAVCTGCGLQSGSTLPFDVGPASIATDEGLDGVELTVGSKEFTEQVILGYILAFSLQAAGADVRDLTAIVGSRSTRDAQITGQVDLTYEYTGNGWINYLGHENPLKDPREQFVAVRDEDIAENGMDWVALAPMDNTYALAASRGVIERTGVTTLSQYAELAKRDPAAARTCVDTEFNVRRDGYPGMAAAYGFDPDTVQRPVLQTGIIYNSTAAGTDCPFGEVYTTDGRVKGLDLVVLTDDLGFFPHYNPAVTLPVELAAKYPQIERIMTPVSDALTNDEITELNRRVDVVGEDPADVARDWLRDRGFVAA
ncbi:glycine betaine ABC transporter substrate-binding protein [Nocardia jiangsuensis]|uniref:Glycine betaine ABC transporter substrate-binding protein n=1 Tax=Nocardia jiangsuensis TaxID=1691563 RepID=A0ABV8DM33_9NOCA